MMLLVLSVGSIGTIQATCASCKTTVVEVSSAAFLDRMHDIQHCIHNVRKNTENNSKEFSRGKLDAIEARITALDADTFDDNEEILDMHDTHIRTLKRELSNARRHVTKHGRNSTQTSSDNVIIQRGFHPSKSAVGRAVS
jgi:hypothetical protein